MKKNIKLIPQPIKKTEPTLDENIGRLIKELRIQKNFTASDLGHIIGISQQQVSRYERGISAFSLELIKKFANVFNMTIWQFMDLVYIIYYLDTESRETINNNDDKCKLNSQYDPAVWWEGKNK